MDVPFKLTAAMLKEKLRAKDLPATGKKADLQTRLLQADGFTLGPDHDTKLIPFEGEKHGRDPATLVGHRITSYELEPEYEPYLKLLTDKGLVNILQWSGPRYAHMAMDESLEAALGAGAGEGKKPGVLITEAAVGKRSGLTAGYYDYRVIGIKLEGMQEMGFVFCQDGENDPYSVPFGDVLVAEKPDQIWMPLE
ncbi:hypothetical protein MMC28_001343 [Mycoblastus sanguinarius]|nr:hypothetical protein [Mycoblastus sanguinarius]